MYKRSAFTLIELLVTIAILSVLGTATVVIINPSQLVKQGRDSTRLSDIAALNNTLGLLVADVPNPSLGLAGAVYLSLPASNSDCSDLGFPVGGVYHCATNTDFTKVDGTGWIPIDLTQLSTGSTLARLPIDPVNNASSSLYYQYIADPVQKTWKIQAVIESDKYQAEATKDAGTADSAYEKGSDLTLGSNVFPSGWIRVPGNSTYDTSDFWVMKYEAKNEGGVATSQISGSPWVSISHTSAKTACTAIGAHLITNEEYMTIARNAEQVSSNWMGGSVGSGALYSGHNDNSPANALSGGSDIDPYSGTGNTTPSNQRRTLALSNGSVIWDLAGNVWEHVQKDSSDTLIRYTPSNGGSVGWVWIEHTAITSYGDLSYDELRPSNSSWNATQGMGRLYTYNGDYGSQTRVLLRGGSWSNSSNAGAFAASLRWDTGTAYYNVGFRCAR